MTGKELYEVINEALGKLNSSEAIYDAKLYFSKTEFQNYTVEQIVEMLKKNKGSNHKSWLSLDNQDGQEGYCAEFIIIE